MARMLGAVEGNQKSVISSFRSSRQATEVKDREKQKLSDVIFIHVFKHSKFFYYMILAPGYHN